jgi:hypothetical protein
MDALVDRARRTSWLARVRVRGLRSVVCLRFLPVGCSLPRGPGAPGDAPQSYRTRVPHGQGRPLGGPHGLGVELEGSVPGGRTSRLMVLVWAPAEPEAMWKDQQPGVGTSTWLGS